MKAIEEMSDEELISYKKNLEDEIGAHNSTQNALKVALNMLYGALANRYFRYFDVRMASAVTLTGQSVVKWCEKSTNEYMNKVLKTDKDYIIAIDTDSVFITMEDMINKYFPDVNDTSTVISTMQKITEKKILPNMAKSFAELYEYLNCYKPRMVIKSESLASAGIFLCRKKYALMVHSNEGIVYAKPKMKVKGIEIIRSSTPEICRSSLKEAVQIIFDSGEKAVQEHIKQFKNKFISSGVNSTSFPRGINELKKWIDINGNLNKGCPIHVRGALNFNRYVDKLGLDKKYEHIHEGDKIRFTYLKMPNPLNSNVIGFVSLMPKEFELEEYIDYELQFQKAFVAPISNILDAVGWQVKPSVNLIDLF